MRDLTKTGNYISTRIGRAIADYNLIEDKDRILVAVSGGKDSLALLKLLNERKRWAPVRYELIAAHIESDFKYAGDAKPAALRKVFKRMGVKYCFKKIRILHDAKEVSCFWCSWNRRKALFLMAEKLGCNKVALGHNKDDIIETLLLNMFYHGSISAMNPMQKLFGGKVTIIRPLCYAEEDRIKAFARESGFPESRSMCPYSQASKRRLMKGIINKVKRDCRYVKTNLMRSMGRINREYLDIKGS